MPAPDSSNSVQNKKRRFGQDEADEREKQAKKEEEALKDAATLYVGNL